MPSIPLIDIDIDCFFESNELCVNAVHDSNEILVIYRENYYNVDDGVMGLDNSSPMALCKLDDVDGIKQGDLFEIEGEDFIVTAVKPNRSELYVKIFLEIA